MAFKVTNSRARGNGGNFTASETVAIRVKSVHTAGKVANYDEDYFIGTLLHNAIGIDVDSSRDPETWVPTKEVKVRMKKPNFAFTADNAPYAVIDLHEGEAKGNAKPMGKNPIVILERAYVDAQTGDVVSGWMHIGANHAPENPLQDTLSGLLSYVHANAWCQVFEEGKKKDRNTGEEKPAQRRQMFLTDYAVRVGAEGDVSSLDNFIAKTAQWLVPNPEMGGGHPSVVLRIASISDPAIVDTTWISPSRDAEGNPEAPEVTLTKWLDEQYAADETAEKESNWKTFISNIDSEPDFVIEMIPVWQFNTGSKSIPSVKAAAGKKGTPDHENFQSYIVEPNGEAAVKDDGSLIKGALITQGHMFIRRKFDGREQSWRPWSASQTTSVKGLRSEFHHITDLPTIVTPDELVARFKGLAEKRSQIAKQVYDASKAPAAEEGKPDDTAGLTGSSFSPS